MERMPLIDIKEVFKGLGMVSVSVFGACVTWLNNRNKKPNKGVSLFAEAVTATAWGLIIYWLSSYFDWDARITYIACVLIGMQGYKVLEKIGKTFGEALVNLLADIASRLSNSANNNKK